MYRTNRSKRRGWRAPTAEFQAEVVEAFLSSGRSIAEVAGQYHVEESLLRQWLCEASDRVVRDRTAGQPRPAAPGPLDAQAVATAEFQAEVVAWHRASGKTIAEVAATLNLPESTIREWVWRSPGDDPDPAGGGDRSAETLHWLDDLPDVPEVIEPSPEAADGAAPEAETVTPVDLSAVLADSTEAVARAEAKASKAIKAKARAEKTAAEAEARAEAAAEREAAARAEIAAAYAAAVEAMVGAELAAAEAISRVEAEAAAVVAQAKDEAATAVAQAQAEAATAVAQAKAEASAAAARAGEAEAAAAAARAEAQTVQADVALQVEAERAARVEAEEAARDEIAATNAAAVEAVLRAEVSVADRVAAAEATAEARGRAQALRSERAPTSDEVAARAEIAQLLARLAPVPVWVQATGRTLAEAQQAALGQLGVDPADAEIDVLPQGSRWFSGPVRVRARVRNAEGTSA